MTIVSINVWDKIREILTRSERTKLSMTVECMLPNAIKFDETRLSLYLYNKIAKFLINK